MKTTHENRRDKAIGKFIENGFEGMSREEALELLFFYTAPSVSMTSTVDRLFKDHTDLSAIVNTSPETLMSEYGLDERSAVLLHVLPELIGKYKNNDEIKYLESVSAAIEYFKEALRHETIEKLMACFLNENLKIKKREVISVGGIDRTAAHPLDLIEAANKAKSKTVIIAHNHPGGSAQASVEDIASTRQIKRALKDVGIELLDHIIVSSDGTAVSMKNEGFFPLLDK